MHRIRPTPTNNYLANPHKGLCTYQRFNGDPCGQPTEWSDRGPDEFPAGGADLVAPHYLPTTVAYCRWYWNQFEKEQGQYDFSIVERGLELAGQRGQTLAIRMMPFGDRREDLLPAWYVRRYPTAVNSQKQVHPIYDSPEFLQRWGEMNREMGNRFDGHPLLETIDMGYIGPWGEGAGECTPDQCARFAAMYAKSFPSIPRLALIEGPQLPAGLASGSGWRCDCFGDLREPGSETVPKHLSFNHMYDAYPREVIIGGARDTWKTAPVHFETCHAPNVWFERGYDIDFIIEQGWKMHGTYFMPKSKPLPHAWMGKFAEFCRKLGYRFILRQAKVDDSVPRDGSFHFDTWIENIGVAPLYRKYDFALRLRQDSREEIIIPPGIDPRTWLPGDAWFELDIKLPPGFRPGLASLSAALVDPATRKPRIKFAVKEQYPDAWVDLGAIEII